MNYQNGKIYSIRSHQTDAVYIGSTVSPLSKRLHQHKNNYNHYLDGEFHYITSFELIKLGDAYIELVEDYPCENKYELKRKEGEVIRATSNCVNRQIAGRTKEEYRTDNRDILAEKQRIYYDNNKDKMVERGKLYREQHKNELEEYQKTYREQHKKILAENHKRWRQKNREQILAKEKEFREQNKKKLKQYREQNKNKLKEKSKQYYDQNRENILLKRKEYNLKSFSCDCGGCYRMCDRAKHLKTKKHQNYLISIQPVEIVQPTPDEVVQV